MQNLELPELKQENLLRTCFILFFMDKLLSVAVYCHEPSVDQPVKFVYDHSFVVCKRSIVVTKSNMFRRLLDDFSTKLSQMLKLIKLIDQRLYRSNTRFILHKYPAI